MAHWVQHIISPGTFLNIPPMDLHKFQIFAAMAGDLLWFYRIKSHHEGINIDIPLISKHINTITMEHFNAWHPSLPIVIDKWQPPPSPWVKINFDTAIRDSFSVQATVCRNFQGKIIQMASSLSPPCHPNYGEALSAS
jgi:hypothetical protein